MSANRFSFCMGTSSSIPNTAASALDPTGGLRSPCYLGYSPPKMKIPLASGQFYASICEKRCAGWKSDVNEARFDTDASVNVIIIDLLCKNSITGRCGYIENSHRKC